MKALAPRLRHRVTFQEFVSSRDSEGVLTEGWQNAWIDSETELVDVPAEVLTGPGREAIAAGAQQADVSARITCRWFPGLDATWRILWDGRVFAILGDPDTDLTGRREWRIKCAAGMNDGQ